MRTEVGSWYWITGRGPALVTALPDPPHKTTITVTLLSGVTYWVAGDEIYQLSTNTLDTYERDLRARLQLTADEEDGLVACRDWLRVNRR